MSDIKITPSPHGRWEYVPAGGMALTAEQAEDVRTVANCALQYGNIASREAASRLDSSLPATEPAEEETKAEEKLVAHRDSKGDIYVGHALVAFKHRSYEQIRRWFNEAHPGGISERRYRAVLHLLNVEASSRVVPAPTETGPWQTWKEVPEGVWYMSRDRVMHNRYVNHGGVRRSNVGLPGLADYAGRIGGFNEAYAPFVAAEEGSA